MNQRKKTLHILGKTFDMNAAVLIKKDGKVGIKTNDLIPSSIDITAGQLVSYINKLAKRVDKLEKMSTK